jgi:hypothetical protein
MIRWSTLQPSEIASLFILGAMFLAFGNPLDCREDWLCMSSLYFRNAIA